MTKLVIFGIGLLLSQCIQFKVDVLKPDLVAQITIGSNPNQIQGIVTNNVLTNIPLYVPTRGGLYYVVDSLNQTIKVFDSQGNLELVLGGQDQDLPSNVKWIRYRWGNIGHLSVDPDGNLYVQNRFGKKEELMYPPKEEDLYKKFSGTFEPSPGSPLPSYILWINKKGELITLIGVRGKNTEPFRIVESILSCKENRLFVFHKYSEEFRLGYYQEGNLVNEIQESRLPVFRSPESKDFRIQLDRMVPHPEGKYALVSLSYLQKLDNRFKYRRIYRVAFDNPESFILLKEIQDPREHIFSVQDNGEFYIWETEDDGNSIRLQVHDEEGNHINNKRLPIDPPRSQWREIYTDGYDNIYSLRIRSGNLEVYRWK